MFERGNLSRRGFMRQSLAGMTAAGLPLWFAERVHADDEDRKTAAARQPGANGKLNLGWVGIGSPASRAFGIYGTTRGFKQLAHVAACDVDARHLKVADRPARGSHQSTTAAPRRPLG